MGIAPSVLEGSSGQGDLLPGGVGLTPKPRTDGLVEGVQGAETLLEPQAERGLIALGQVFRALAVDLVIELPGDHAGMLSVVLAQFFGDACRKCAELLGGEIGVPTVSVADPMSVLLSAFRAVSASIIPYNRRHGKYPRAKNADNRKTTLTGGFSNNRRLFFFPLLCDKGRRQDDG